MIRKAKLDGGLGGFVLIPDSSSACLDPWVCTRCSHARVYVYVYMCVGVHVHVCMCTCV